jgi:hypothetical protein
MTSDGRINGHHALVLTKVRLELRSLKCKVPTKRQVRDAVEASTWLRGDLFEGVVRFVTAEVRPSI